MSVDVLSPLGRARHNKLLEELKQRVSTTLTNAGLTLFPAGEEGSDPGGAVVNLEKSGVSVGWFTSDALIDGGSGEELIEACQAAMVNAMVTILVAAGMSVTLRPWDFDGDAGRTSLYVALSRET
ncbi:hypothetical protein [Nocardiopsis sp. L17-MgMaSL7]|uniref:hypothetical protein n=1 Tax=Nocardiopsis sp. L17-MgMaSL7 TaxID=1938893 RepID=UPI000D7152B1|nr:hypothetical protein [Nocardiopsis sp. L17-MgMaSL7]PWV44588.1 hypothetical protein BDW27_12347 [Nocardiopsis sp. L17-MgMaSL7]